MEFEKVSTAGLESSPVAPALARLRAKSAASSSSHCPLEATAFQVENIRIAYVPLDLVAYARALASPVITLFAVAMVRV